jgi:hypothetical protein
MIQLAVVTTGSLFGPIELREGDAGLMIGRDVLDLIGVHEGDEIELHTDGTLLIVMRAMEGTARPSE